MQELNWNTHSLLWILTKIPLAYHECEKYGLNLDSPSDCSLGCIKGVLCKDTGDNTTSLKPEHITPLWLYTVWLNSKDGNWCDDGEEHSGGLWHWQLSDVHKKKLPDFSDKSWGLCLYHYARNGGVVVVKALCCLVCLVTEDKPWLPLV